MTEEERKLRIVLGHFALMRWHLLNLSCLLSSMSNVTSGLSFISTMFRSGVDDGGIFSRLRH